MTAQTDDQPDVTGWASRELKCQDRGFSAESGRILKELSECGFLPSPNRDVALRVITGAPESRELPISSMIWQEESARLNGSIDEFATKFFQIPSSERLQQWRLLSAQIGFAPNLVGRLRRLGMGVSVDQNVVGSSQQLVQGLANELAHVFTAPAQERKDRTRRFISNWGNLGQSGKLAANELSKLNRSLAALAPKAPRIETQVRASREAQPERPRERNKRGFGTWIAIGLIASVLRFCLSTGPDSNRVNNPPPNIYRLPQDIKSTITDRPYIPPSENDKALQDVLDRISKEEELRRKRGYPPAPSLSPNGTPSTKRADPGQR
jgi:hypothetical protein